MTNNLKILALLESLDDIKSTNVTREAIRQCLAMVEAEAAAAPPPAPPTDPNAPAAAPAPAPAAPAAAPVIEPSAAGAPPPAEGAAPAAPGGGEMVGTDPSAPPPAADGTAQPDAANNEQQLKDIFDGSSFTKRLAPAIRNAVRKALTDTFPTGDWNNADFKKQFIEANDKINSVVKEIVKGDLKPVLGMYKNAAKKALGMLTDDEENEDVMKDEEAKVEAALGAYRKRKTKHKHMSPIGMPFIRPNWIGFNSAVPPPPPPGPAPFDVGGGGDGGGGE